MTSLQGLTSAEIALAFNNANTRKTWTARANSRPESGRDMVHFSTTTGIVALSYNCMDGRFQVQFNRMHATWGDYVKSIARTLHIVLNTLKASGLPIDAPASAAGVEVVVTASDDATTYVRWNNPQAVLVSLSPSPYDKVREAIMPEQRPSPRYNIDQALLAQPGGLSDLLVQDAIDQADKAG